MDDIEKKLVDYIEKNKNDYVSFLQKLLKVPSLTGEEKDAQVFVANELKAQGFSVEMFEPDVKELFDKYPQIAQIPSLWNPEYDMPLKTNDVFTYAQLMESKFDKNKSYKDRPNVVAKLPGSGGGKSLILNGHIDVVTIGDRAKWTHDPWGAEISDGKIFARGATDMKGGIAAMIKAMEAIIKSGVKLRGDIMMQTVVNEEHAGNGALACVAKGYKADAVIITEPTGSSNVNIESGGGVYWEIRLKGRETHAGCRWDEREQYGISAIEKTPLIINKLLDMERSLNKDAPNNISLCVGMIKGGTYSTSTALECTLNGVAYFSANLGTGDEGLIKVKNLLKECVKNIDDPWLKQNPAEILFQHYDDAYRMGDNGKEILSTLISSGKDLGKDIKTGKMSACDARHIGNKGKMPVVVYGPGCPKTAHSADEHIYIDDYINVIKVLAVTIYRWSK